MWFLHLMGHYKNSLCGGRQIPAVGLDLTIQAEQSWIC